MRNFECRQCGFKKEQDNRRTFVLVHITLDILMFDFAEYPFVSTSKTLVYGNNVVMGGGI